MDILELCDEILDENREILELLKQSEIKDDIVETILSILKDKAQTNNEADALKLWNSYKQELLKGIKFEKLG